MAKISAAEIKDIAMEVCNILTLNKEKEAEVVEDKKESKPVAHMEDNSSPAADALEETEARLIRELAEPRLLTTRGRNRTMTINLTQQALDNLRRLRRERDGKGTVTYS